MVSIRIGVLVVTGLLLLLLMLRRNQQVPVEENLAMNVSGTLEPGSAASETDTILKEIPESIAVPAEVDEFSICTEKYKDRTFVEPAGLVTSLSSFPGSGNTWVRALIEYATGYHTGAVYKDPSLVGIFAGEGVTNGSVIAIKQHFAPDVNDQIGFEQAIFITRHPYDALLAEYSRIKAEGSHNDSQPYISLAEFKDWMKTMMSKYAEIVERQIYTMKYSPIRSMLVKFEDLQSKTEESIKKIVQFLQLPVQEDRIRCALMLADHGSIHRKRKADRHQVYSADRAFTCEVWKTVRRAAVAAGYDQKYTNCYDEL